MARTVLGSVLGSFLDSSSTAMPWGGLTTAAAVLRAARPHQWAKNFLLLLPLVLAHATAPSVWLAAAVGFTAFSLCASAVYVFNDLVDVRADRLHPAKRHRPFASGALSVTAGRVMIAVLLSVAFSLAASFLPPSFLLLIGIYLFANVCYSTRLKRTPIVDVMMLAGMYSLRVEAGSLASGVELSPWMLAFCLFFFTSLAFAKRYTELLRIVNDGGTAAAGRGYRVEDLGILESLGTASGYVGVLVLALYMNSDQMRSLYGESRFLWLICPLVMYWITNVWLLARRGELDEDPVVFAIHDRGSLCIAGACASLVVLAACTSKVPLP